MAIAVSLTVASLLLRHSGVASGLLVIAFIALGLTAAQVAHYRFAVDDIARFASDEPSLAWIEGTIVDDPRLIRPNDIGRPLPPRMATLVDVSAVRTREKWQSASGRTLLQISRPDPRLGGGDIVRLFGWLERPGPAVNAGQFDYANYYRGRRTPTSFRTDGPATIELLASPPPSPARRFRSVIRQAFSAGFDAHQRNEAALLRMMLLGDRDPAMADAREAFRASGTSHFLAVSGLHVGIIGGIAFGLVRLLGAGPKVATTLTGLIILMYAFAADPSPPVLRATLLALSFGVGLLLSRRAAGVQLLAAAAVVLLVITPLDLYRAGFQLSFVAVLCLMLLSGGVRRYLQGATGPDDDASLARRDDRLVRLAARVDERMITGLAAALVAWVASMPLVALHFGSFHAWAIPASLAASPLVAVSLLAGLAKIVLTLLVPDLAWLWADIAAGPVAMMNAIVQWFATLPGADVPLPRPGLWLILALYVSLILLWLTTSQRLRRPDWVPASAKWAARIPLIVTATLVFVIPIAGRPGTTPIQRPLRVTLLAVGAGQCAAIELPGGGVTLIDAGSMSLGRPWASAIGPFLRAGGYAEVDRLLISHANADHYNAGVDIAARYDPAEVIVASRFAGDAATDGAGRYLLAEFDRLDLPVRVVSSGETIALSSDTTLRVLWPPAAPLEEWSANDVSLVVRLEHAGRRMLITGDIQRDAMVGLLEQAVADPDLLRADVLVAPHHGSTEPETQAILQAVDAAYVISSDGRRLSQKQRRLDDLVTDVPLYRTGRDGAIAVEMPRDGPISVTTFLKDDRPTLVYPE